MSEYDSTVIQRCNGCGEEWPYTERFFWRGRKTCRACKAKTQRTREMTLAEMRTPDSHKVCVSCEKRWPKTPQFFHRKTDGKGGFTGQCKICRARSESGRAIAIKELTGVEVPKRCSRCGETKPADAFPHRSNSKNGLRSSWCRQCNINSSGKWYKRERGRYLLKTYGITMAEYDEMFIAQDGRCAICRVVGADSIGRALHVDHSHRTQHVRGLLCFRCNAAVGQLNDDPEVAQRLTDYLRRT